jgi:Bacterial toxin homologue of phage lysozyme, C-term
MADSRALGVLGRVPFSADLPPPRSPGVLGWMDAASPDWLGRILGDTPGPLGLNDAAAAAAASRTPAASPSRADGPLQVGDGQVTFDAEGNDDPKTIYFSRMVHWPGNDLSGVTLGRGYDMGDRSSAEVQADLEAAGLTAERAKAFAAGAGKKGGKAETFVKDNKTTLGEISHDEQKALFRRIYPDYVERAKKNYDKWTAAEKDRTAWDLLDGPIRDVLVDLVYQGFTQGPNPMKKGMRNDYDEFIKYIEGTPALSQYERGRGRAAYLRAHKPASN